ncbi:Uncharacterised protein [Mycobacteroides abscessus subsp. abscessus]|uniref:hypothetical protein n=1 Tax=Mycobacteroides abscessus TaxID=36809 RepID=UPI000926E753|nr:hypothetical protein [Mycobacteroides abscessus]SIH19504.1 Uncharacterised protein [Mycobacteroides abscessus subsp. abscessus]
MREPQQALSPMLAQVRGNQDAATIEALKLENQRLRKAIDGLRKYARVDQMTAEQQEGYHMASIDLLVMLAPVRGYTLGEDLPPLGWGRDDSNDRPD